MSPSFSKISKRVKLVVNAECWLLMKQEKWILRKVVLCCCALLFKIDMSTNEHQNGGNISCLSCSLTYGAVQSLFQLLFSDLCVGQILELHLASVPEDLTKSLQGQSSSVTDLPWHADVFQRSVTNLVESTLNIHLRNVPNGLQETMKGLRSKEGKDKKQNKKDT